MLAFHPGNLDERGRLVLVADDQVDSLEVVPHFGDVAQTHYRAVPAAKYDDLFEILLIVPLPDGSNAYLSVQGVNFAGRQVEGTAANRGRDVVQGKSQGTQLV